MAGKTVTYTPIGVVSSPFETAGDVPTCVTESVDASGTVEIDDDYAEGLTRLEGFSHVVLVTHLHETEDERMRCDPPFADVRPGIFATRGPSRPNPIGLSIVRLTDLEGTTLAVDGLDLVDGTPVLDVKPFAPKADELRDLDGGWIEEHTDQDISP